jgi:hypothetical protein
MMRRTAISGGEGTSFERVEMAGDGDFESFGDGFVSRDCEKGLASKLLTGADLVETQLAKKDVLVDRLGTIVERV